MTYALSPGNRVIWNVDYKEVKAQITRVWKNKAEIVTDSLEKIKVPLDELELVPVVEKPKPSPFKKGDRVRDCRVSERGVGEIKQAIAPPNNLGNWMYGVYWEKLGFQMLASANELELVREQTDCTLTDCTLTDDDDARWNPSDFGECDRVVESNGQVTIFDNPTIEPPDPDDYITIAEYEKAYRNWKSVREQTDCTLTPDTEVNFNPKDYSSQEEWLDDSINQFFYEEGAYDLIVPTFPDESVREQDAIAQDCTLTDATLESRDNEEKLHPNSWIEEKMIKRAGKLHGPYRYERWRDENGKMKSKYLGKKTDFS